MKLPEDFQFSQSNLQDFVDCRRRFQLKHLLRLAWPAVEIEPVLENERLIENGSSFHQLVHQFALGIPLSDLKVTARDDELAIWWDHFQTALAEGGSLHSIWMPSTQRYSEITLSGRLGNTRMIAKIDLIAIHPEGLIQIFDWKTSQHVPERSWLAQRIQTKVYPYLLTQAGSFLNKGQPINPAQLEMVYWYPTMPKEPIHFTYSQKQFQEDHDYLQSLLNTIQHLNENEFNLTNDENRCKFCIYRSLCNRGISAGQIVEFEQFIFGEEDTILNIDFNQIDEVAF